MSSEKSEYIEPICLDGNRRLNLYLAIYGLLTAEEQTVYINQTSLDRRDVRVAQQLDGDFTPPCAHSSKPYSCGYRRYYAVLKRERSRYLSCIVEFNLFRFTKVFFQRDLSKLKPKGSTDQLTRGMNSPVVSTTTLPIPDIFLY